jgi:hypothetical protein
MAINMGFDSSKDSSLTRPLLFFFFFLGFLAFLIDVSVGVNVGVGVGGADSRDISDIGQSLFKICLIENNGYFGSG